MYKTVRHGENSLQYKILAQQEEGLPGVKRRKSPKAFIVKFIAIVTLLLILIMASAFLVPLLLANDFITVTGTFQKFSVSTLRRSHSGNHVVVIAKKPYGWNAAHPTMPPRPSNASRTPDNEAEKSSPSTKPPLRTNTTNEPTSATRSTALTTARIPMTTRTTATTRATEGMTTMKTFSEGAIPFQVRSYELTTSLAPERTTAAQGKKQWGWVGFPPTKTSIQHEQRFQKERPEGEMLSSKSEPVWFKPEKKREFGSSDFDKADEQMIRPLYVMAGFVIVAVIMCFGARKMLCRRTLPEKETAESKEDKRKLLKPAASSDHDEE